MGMKIGFTGHRDRHTDPQELAAIAEEFPGAVWVHGGALDGFDQQVDAYAREHGISRTRIRPNYQAFPPRVAPLRRNDKIVGQVDLLVACWDGRKTGGTFYTVRKAEGQGVPVRYVACLPPE
jgi:hypothetical protein